MSELGAMPLSKPGTKPSTDVIGKKGEERVGRLNSAAARQAGDIGTAFMGARVTATLADGTVTIKPDFLVVKGVSRDGKLLLGYVEAKASVKGVPGKGAVDG